MKPADISKYIRERRSIYPKMYSDKVIDREIIEEMLENANWAPTHKLTEPWRFVVFTGEGLKTLGEVQAKVYSKVATEAGDFDTVKYENLKNKPLEASHVIAIIMKRNEKKLVPEIEEVSSVAMAVQNMYLTASAYKIGCYWGTGGITYMDDAKEEFNLEADDKLMGFLYVGHTDKPWPEGRRKPMEDKVQWVEG